jgi:hypothetical protein
MVVALLTIPTRQAVHLRVEVDSLEEVGLLEAEAGDLQAVVTEAGAHQIRTNPILLPRRATRNLLNLPNHPVVIAIHQHRHPMMKQKRGER